MYDVVCGDGCRVHMNSSKYPECRLSAAFQQIRADACCSEARFHASHDGGRACSVSAVFPVSASQADLCSLSLSSYRRAQLRTILSAVIMPAVSLDDGEYVAAGHLVLDAWSVEMII